MIVICAMLLDAVFGEPKWLWSRVPHPVVLFGKAISRCDARLNHGDSRRRNGVFAMAMLGSAAVLMGWAITLLPGIAADVCVAAILLAQRSLVDHLAAVASGLNRSLEDGRRAVAMIVSRDTSAMDTSAVCRSTIESGAENLSDGVIAPIFWCLIGGMPGLLLYKITNTADSMIGYRTEKYQDFGWAAARFDDTLNWVPARLTALLIWLTDRQSAGWAIVADARKHRSPNAGWPEAAMAHKHQIALAGPRSYDGTLTDFPYVNTAGRKDLTPADISQTTRTLWQVWALALGLSLIAALL